MFYQDQNAPIIKTITCGNSTLFLTVC